MTLISSYLPFPNISWWTTALSAGAVCFDAAEHFQKMSYRNRYYITGGNGLIPLSIPLVQGREQRKPVSQVSISYAENWQVQHWRTLVSVYSRTPFFEHYAPSLEQLFTNRFLLLADFNRATVEWVLQQLKLKIDISETTVFQREYGGGYDDVRNMRPGIEKKPFSCVSPYYQPFSERNGFLPDLSILDLVFAEGPYALQWLEKHTYNLPWHT